MNEFNPVLLICAVIAALLSVLLFVLLARQRYSEQQEATDLLPAPIAAPPPLLLLAEAHIAAASERPPFEPWRLVERLLANPESVGGPLYRLCFAGEYGAMPTWQPGAIAHIYCGPARDHATGSAPIGQYVIGSIPTDGLLDIVVRQTCSDNPEEGHRARFLCEKLQPGDMVAIALRNDPSFLPPPPTVPMILIGNATGIAGLHAHIRARPQGTRNWLIYGDRRTSSDRALAAEIIDWLSTGHLERCDLVLPGEGQQKRLVVDQLDDASGLLLDWTLAGSAIYVCGSKAMGADVDATLTRLLGREVLDVMIETGRYQRSLY